MAPLTVGSLLGSSAGGRGAAGSPGAAIISPGATGAVPPGGACPPGTPARSVIDCPSELELGATPLSGVGAPAAADGPEALSPAAGEKVEDGGAAAVPSLLEQPLRPSVSAAPSQRSTHGVARPLIAEAPTRTRTS